MRVCCFVIYAVALSILGVACPASAGTIAPGFDLFSTIQPTNVTTGSTVQFQGVPLGAFNFGGSVGVQNVGSTDTIIQRLAPATSPGPAIIPIEIVALHLQTTAPANFGLGTGTYFLTLQKERNGPSSIGQMTINFNATPPPDGTFTISQAQPLNLFYDIRLRSEEH